MPQTKEAVVGGEGRVYVTEWENGKGVTVTVAASFGRRFDAGYTHEEFAAVQKAYSQLRRPATVELLESQPPAREVA